MEGKTTPKKARSEPKSEAPVPSGAEPQAPRKKSKHARRRQNQRSDAPPAPATPSPPPSDQPMNEMKSLIKEMKGFLKAFKAVTTPPQPAPPVAATPPPAPPPVDPLPTKPEEDTPPAPTVEAVEVGELSPPVVTKFRELKRRMKRDPRIVDLPDARALRAIWAETEKLVPEEIALLPSANYFPAIRFEPHALAGHEHGYTWVVSQDRTNVLWKTEDSRARVSACDYADGPTDMAGPWAFYGSDPLMAEEDRSPTPGWEWCEHSHHSTWTQARGSWDHFLNFVRPATRVGLINVTVEAKVRNRMSGARTLTSSSVVQQAVDAAYRELPEWKHIIQLAPRAFEETVKISTLRLLWSTIEKDALTTESVAAQTAAHLVRLRSAEDALFNPRPQIHSRRYQYAAVCLALAFLAWKYKTRASWWSALRDFWARVKEWAQRLKLKARELWDLLWAYRPRNLKEKTVEYVEAIREVYHEPPSSAQHPLYVMGFKRTVQTIASDPFSTVVAPVMEEILKRSAFTNPWAALFVAGMVIMEGPVNMVKHALFAALPLPLGILLHAVNNVIALSTAEQAATPMVGWRERQRVTVGESTCWSLVDVLHNVSQPIVLPVDNTGIEIYGPDHAVHPRMTALCEFKPLNPDMIQQWTPSDSPITDHAIPRFDYEATRNPITYPIRYGSIPPWAPARCEWNLWYVVRTRLLTAQVLTNIAQRAVWRSIRPFPIYDPQWAPTEITDPLFEEFLTHMIPAKRRAYIRARAQNVEDPTLVDRRLTKIQIMIKTDEVLFRPTLHGDQVALEHKPRAIANVHISVSAALGPWIYMATQRLKQQWNGFQQPYEMGVRLVVPVFASSFDDYTLTTVYNHAMESVLANPSMVFIFVAGDDSLVIASNTSGLVMYEGDFSQYDAAQMEGPLELEYKMLELLGVPPPVLTQLQASNAAPWEVLFRTTQRRLLIQRPASRNTGGVDTTLGNSLLNALMWAECLKRPRTEESIIPFFASLGFELKLKTMGPGGYPTFLKGMWYPVAEVEYPWGVWAPLPSRILKLGKALKSPTSIYGRDLETSARAFLRDNACGLAPFLPVPLLRAFCAKWQGGPEIRARVTEENTSHKVAPSGRFRQMRPLAPEMVLSLRYFVPPQWFDEVEEMIGVQPMWSVLHHPLLIRLLGVDYAGW